MPSSFGEYFADSFDWQNSSLSNSQSSWKKKTGYYSNEQIAIEEIDGVLEKGKEFIKLVQGKSAIHCQIFSFSGWINGAGLVDKGQRGVAALFFITGALFLLLALCELYLLRKVIASCTKAIANAHFTL